MTSEPAIAVSELEKKFGRFVALNGLNLEVAPGTVHGFLGPNGAGKSTTIRILLGLMKKNGGTARILGRDVWAERVHLHSRLAYVPGDVTLWPSMTGGECIDLLLRMRGERGHEAAPWRDSIVERLDLDPSKKAKTYSKGNRQKVALAAAFAAPVELLILDEPTSGLDPLMESIFQELIAEAANRGTTVLLSSHILAEVERLCDAVTIIRKGETVESGPLSSLRQRNQSKIKARLERMVQEIEQIPGVQDVAWNETEVEFTVEANSVQVALDTLSKGHIETLTVEQASLEELFMRHYATELTATGGAK